MKKILFDLTKTQPVNGSKYHGGGKYGKVVFKKLVEIAPEKIAAYYDSDKYIDESILELCHKNNIPTIKKCEYSILDAAKKYGSLLYSPLMDPAYLKDSSVHIIVTIHGLRVLEMPYDDYEIFYSDKYSVIKRLFSKTKLFKFLLAKKRNQDYKKDLYQKRIIFSRNNFSFITVSNHSKYSLLTFIPNLDAEKLKVFYSPSTIDDSIPLDKYENPYGKYYLIVSGDRWMKNGMRAIIALDELFTEHPEIKGNVVVTGIKQKTKLSIDIKNKNRFIFVGYVNEYQLKGLYHCAYLLIYPSLNEGFGYPPLEAMHEGCPVIASAIASIPEVCGDSVMYFNPYSISEMKMRVMQMEDECTRQDYIKKGFERQNAIQQKQDKDLFAIANYILSFIKK